MTAKRIDVSALMRLLIAADRGATKQELLTATGLTSSSFHRLLINAKTELGVVVACTGPQREEGSAGSVPGRYKVEAWGVFNRAGLMRMAKQADN